MKCLYYCFLLLLYVLQCKMYPTSPPFHLIVVFLRVMILQKFFLAFAATHSTDTQLHNFPEIFALLLLFLVIITLFYFSCCVFPFDQGFFLSNSFLLFFKKKQEDLCCCFCRFCSNTFCYDFFLCLYSDSLRQLKARSGRNH